MKATASIQLSVAAVVLLLACNAFAKGKEKEKDKDGNVTVAGSIADSQCAFNVHSSGRSHDWMIKTGVPGASDDKSCTNHCVKDMGGSFVLVAKDEVYRLDDQTYAERFAGAKVKVTGTLDPKTKTLHVRVIEENH